VPGGAGGRGFPDASVVGGDVDGLVAGARGVDEDVGDFAGVWAGAQLELIVVDDEGGGADLGPEDGGVEVELIEVGDGLAPDVGAGDAGGVGVVEEEGRAAFTYVGRVDFSGGVIGHDFHLGGLGLEKQFLRLRLRMTSKNKFNGKNNCNGKRNCNLSNCNGQSNSRSFDCV
jgi:hypothetical protein